MMDKLSVSICLPAYNEEKNISSILEALVTQILEQITINKIVVVSSASTDETDSIVEKFAKDHPQVMLIKQPERKGKADGINAFLKVITDEVVVIESADTIPDKNCIEKLCAPFLNDKNLGMVGGAPHPVNDPDTFLGYIVHAWWWFHRNIPRFGEIIAFRNIFPQISKTTAVDEAYIQARIIQKDFSVIHIDDAIVTNKGAETIADLIMQRRRVMNGHARLYQNEGVKIDNMTKSSLYLLLFKFKLNNLKELTWLIGGIAIEFYARILGAYDFYIAGTNPFIWDIATTTKNLAYDKTNAKNIMEDNIK